MQNKLSTCFYLFLQEHLNNMTEVTSYCIDCCWLNCCCVSYFMLDKRLKLSLVIKIN